MIELPLSKHFESSVAKSTLSTILMVGALPHPIEGVSQNDQTLLRMSLDTLQTFGVSISEALSHYLNNPNLSTFNDNDIEIMNLHTEYGKRDFLKEDKQADITILCNIPKTAPKYDDLVEVENGLNIREQLSLMDSFIQSPNHFDLDKWKSAIDRTQSAIVFVYGSDSFYLDDICSDLYLPYSQFNERGTPINILIRKDYLENNAYFLARKESPLADFAIQTWEI